LSFIKQAINNVQFDVGVVFVVAGTVAFLIWNRWYRPYGRRFPMIGLPTIPLVILILALAYSLDWLHTALLR
jgi:hypothetical protein